MEFFKLTNPNLWISIYLTIINAVLMCFASYKFFQVLQLGGYSIRAYFNWLKDTKARWISRVIMLFCFTLVTLIASNVLLGAYDHHKLLGYIGLIFYFIFVITFIIAMLKVPQKTPLKLTKRMWRLILLYFFSMVIVSFLLLSISIEWVNFARYSSIAITIILIPLMVPLCNIINRPFETLIKNIFKKRSRKKLASFKNLKVIGITGSYGKTSTKHFLKEILSQKYNVYSSPSSFNTPMGLSKVILKELSQEHQIFIAEMGATRKGDIKEICDFVKPNVAVLTGVGNQHLKTFQTLENIKNTKYELIESLNEQDNAYFNINSNDMQNLYDKCNLVNKKRVVLNDQNQDFTCFDIVANDKGLAFKMKLKTEIIDCKTKVLGDHNIENILLASVIAYDLGVTPKMIARAISKLKSVNHRLELSKAQNGVIILDDSFNSNVSGTKQALKTLSYFTNKRKVIVTPGLVELGDIEAELNEQFGKDIAQICDIAIIVNTHNKKAIESGLLSQNFDENNIYFVDTLRDAVKLFETVLKHGDVVLLENDLPDNYI